MSGTFTHAIEVLHAIYITGLHPYYFSGRLILEPAVLGTPDCMDVERGRYATG